LGGGESIPSNGFFMLYFSFNLRIQGETKLVLTTEENKNIQSSDI